MVKVFESNILKNQLFNKDRSLLLAISGGVDSVVLAHLLKEGGYKFSMAHCNFNLRGKASADDEKFCRQLAREFGVKIYVKQFDVKKYCEQHAVSIQMAARELRYDWFKKLMKEERFDKLLTAHHANDAMETVLINLLRGTGVKGLKGIPLKNGNIIRPLLNFTRKEIEQFAKKEKIKHRTDKSNFEDKYERNYLRLKVIPKLKKINPELEQTFIKNIMRFSREAEVVNDFIDDKIKKLVKKEKNLLKIDRAKLKNEKHAESVLHSLLSPLKFSGTQLENILSAIHNSSNAAKHFLSGKHKLVVERNHVHIISTTKPDRIEIKIPSIAELKDGKIFSFTKEKKFRLPTRKEFFIPLERLKFPLTVRHYKTGDKFKPFGMKGYKLLSDFLKDEKVSTIEKDNCKVLINGTGEIMWVIGYRSDERYRVDAGAKKLVKFAVLE